MNIENMIINFFVSCMPLIAIVTIAVAIASFRRAEKGLYFSSLLFAFSIYVLGYFLELNSSSLEVLTLVRNIEYAGVFLIPTLSLLYICQLTEIKVKKVFKNMLFVISIILWSFFITNPIHLLFYKKIELFIGDYALLKTINGTFYYVVIGYYMLSLAISSVILFKAYKIEKQQYLKSDIAFVLITFQIAWFPLIFILLGFNKHMDIVPYTIIAMCIVLLINEIKRNILELHIKKWESIFNGIEEPAFLVNIDGAIVSSNKMADSLLSAMEGNLETVIKEMDKCISTRLPMLFTADGGGRWFDIRKNDFQAKSKFYNYLLIEITDRKLIEEEIRENKKFLETLLEFMPTPVFYKDINGIYLGFNKAFEDFFGKTKEELIGKSVFDINPYELAKIYHSKDMELLEKPSVQVYETQVEDAREVLHDVIFHKATITNLAGEPAGLIGTLLDITERKKLETELSNEKKLLETTLISVGDGVISTDNEGHIVFLNRAADFLTGWSQVAAEGKVFEEVFNAVNEATGEKLENIVKKALEKKSKVELANHTLLVSKDGIPRPIEHSAAPIVQENGEIIGAVLVFRDCSEKKQKQERIEFLSYHDQLTGLYNRRFYEEELKRLDVKRNLPLTIVMGDVNGLKLINDSFGHSTGDELIKRVAQVITRGCRSDDIIARLGGDEFVILLPKTGEVETENILKRINCLASKEKVESIDISISFGYETKHKDEEEIKDIWKKAEDYMYKKKLFESPSMRGKTVNTIISTLHEKNKQEEEHSRRVSALCKEMGIAIGLSEHRVEVLKTVGLLHDIGKIAIDENILNKPGKLTDDECKEIQRHSEIGYRILSTVNDMSEMAEYVLYHHERWDGKGYPKGLKAQEIPIESRIIFIADAYDSMASDRSYRGAMEKDRILNELRKNAGTQFDPELVSIFIEDVLEKSMGI
ncbi:MAG: HD domain-containing phosphohydrolase [Proteocatella sp.]